MKTVLSIVVNDKEYYKSFGRDYFTDDIRTAKIYNCRAWSKVRELKSLIEHSNFNTPTGQPRIYLETNGKFGNYLIEDIQYLTEEIVRSAKLQEVIITLRDSIKSRR